MNKLLVRFDKKLKQVLDMGGMWEDKQVDDLDKVVVLEDFTFDDIKYTKDTEIEGITVFYDMRMTEKQINKALIEFLVDKADKHLGKTNFVRGKSNGA